jgi:DUF1680 family protein
MRIKSLERTSNCATAILLLFLVTPTLLLSQQSSVKLAVDASQQLLPSQDVVLKGLLGEGADANVNGRLKSLMSWEDNRLLKLFSRDSVAENSGNVKAHQGTDWRGEHAGKWMYTAARAAYRTGDKELLDIIKETTDYLLSQQGEDGYLGTYAPSVRFTSDVREDFSREWDIWNHTYNILGFLEINRYWPDERYLEAAVKMGDLLYNTFYKTGKSVAYRGNHLGLSGTIVLEAIVELYKVTGQKKFLEFAEVIMQQIEDRPGLQIVSSTLKGYDSEYVGDGKIYQLCWNYMAIAKLYEITGNPDYLKTVELAWNNIAEYHLTLGGSPWGGIGAHHEVFNRKGYWNPYGFVETCNTMAWIHMNRELLRLTGEAKYAGMIERAAYNALVGAQYPDGEGWCYFIFENGKRHLAIYRDCCRSSGMVALEEISPMVYGIRKDGISVNIYTASEGEVFLPEEGKVKIVQQTNYPLEDEIKLQIDPEKQTTFSVFLRIPEWADEASVVVNGKRIGGSAQPGTFFEVSRRWQRGDEVQLKVPMKLQLHARDEYERHRGSDIYRISWQAMTRGPLAYSVHGLLENKQREGMLSLPKKDPDVLFSSVPTPSGYAGPAFQLNVSNGEPPVFLPYYEAGGREVGSWRLTWFQVDYN